MLRGVPSNSSNRSHPGMKVDIKLVIMACSELLTRKARNDLLKRLKTFRCFAPKALVIVVGAMMIDGAWLGWFVAAVE